MTLVSRIMARLPSPLVLAGAGGGIVACGLLVMPGSLLESLVLKSGIAAIVTAAEPPLGLTARAALALLLGGGAGGTLWLGAVLLRGEEAPEPVEAPAPVERPIPVLRRADAHPDAPPRRPLFAEQELGTPFLDVTAPAGPPAERDLPVDLDQPLAMFDPAAILPTPRAPVRPVAPLTLTRPALLEPGERFETFPLATPPVIDDLPPPPRPAPVQSTEATLQSLLERLERGVQQREEQREEARRAEQEAQKPASLSDALTELRRMATQR